VLAVDGQHEPSSPRPRLAGELAGGDEALLVRERERDAAFERPQRGVDAGEADDRVQDDVGLGLLGASPSIGVEPDVAPTTSRPGFAAMTSRAWRPIEPVAPRTAIRRFTCSV
jgi:hypothetical protein